MKYFVPRFGHDAPETNRKKLINMFAEIDPRDIPAIIESWRAADALKKLRAIKRAYRMSVKAVCEYPSQKGTLEPYLRRPHITLHGGSKPGKPHCSEHDKEVAEELGGGVAELGFNLWYGGGKDARMGDYLTGFTRQIAKHRYPDQYSVQVSPAPFAFPQHYQSANGLGPANEGLSQNSDIALIIPKFVSRQDLLDSICTAAISGVGGTGSIFELMDVLVHKKTGLRDTLSYVLNEYRPNEGVGYWDHLMKQIKLCIDEGYESPKTISHMKVLPTAKEILAQLKTDTDALGLNPHVNYEKYCRDHGIKVAAIRPTGTPKTTVLAHPLAAGSA